MNNTQEQVRYVKETLEDKDRISLSPALISEEAIKQLEQEGYGVQALLFIKKKEIHIESNKDYGEQEKLRLVIIQKIRAFSKELDKQGVFKIYVKVATPSNTVDPLDETAVSIGFRKRATPSLGCVFQIADHLIHAKTDWDNIIFKLIKSITWTELREGTTVAPIWIRN